MEFKKRYASLNDRQKEAVDYIDGPLMVIAGPGTGKTELLSVRVANILQRTDTLPENILCLTFTDNGANAMRERLIDIMGQEAYKVAIHTFHSFGSEVINQNSDYFYNGAQFKPADKLTSYEVLANILDDIKYDNTLSTKFNGKYSKINDIANAISDIKRGGFTSEELVQILDTNQIVIEKVNKILDSIFDIPRINKEVVPKLIKALASIGSIDQSTALGLVPLSSVIADSLDTAIEQYEIIKKTTPITAWRNSWLEKNHSNKWVLKSEKAQKKLRDLLPIYGEYIQKMHEAELYDYDDMILNVVHGLEKYEDLKFNLQEKYQYILVDEFQDTNMAQMRILHNLADNEVNNGLPNIMVVGDDDQAIFSFQGADVSNIINFKDRYPKTKIIALTDNYRSVEQVLHGSDVVVSQIENRLIDTIDGLSKKLSAHNKNNGGVHIYEADMPIEERYWIAKNIKKQIEDGVKPKDIAIIARKHKDIELILPYFNHFNIPVSYEKKDDVLDSELIILIEKIANMLAYLASGRHEDADSLLPEILSHKAWAIEPIKLWRLSLKAYKERKGWLELMENEIDFAPIQNWIIRMASLAQNTPLELMLDLIVGNSKTKEDLPMTSPIYQYYFSDENRQKNSLEYLSHLDALTAIRNKIREYQPNRVLKLDDFIKFLDLSRKTGSNVESVRQTPITEKSVNLMTAHKAKGLEFEVVYILNANENVWRTSKSPGNQIRYPENLPIQRAGESNDEKIRLFYVAITRAKNQLLITYSQTNDNNKKTLPVSFLANSEWPKLKIEELENTDEMISVSEIDWLQDIIKNQENDMKKLLGPVLDSYKISATHLNTFIDVTRGGPQAFLTNNLLRFPTAKTPSASFGTAIHSTLQHVHNYFSKYGAKQPIEDSVKFFESEIEKEHLLEKDFKKLKGRGGDTLMAFLKEKYDDFSKDQIAELNFSNQNSILDDARLAGKLDLVEIDNKNKTIHITDYKTGKPFSNWKATSDADKIKLHKYKQQLLFYKLLLENSRDYHNFKVKSGAMQFVEPDKQGAINDIVIDYQAEDIDKFEKLVKAVWAHIISLDLPDVSRYDSSYKGVLEFEKDLIEGKI